MKCMFWTTKCIALIVLLRDIKVISVVVKQLILIEFIFFPLAALAPVAHHAEPILSPLNLILVIETSLSHVNFMLNACLDNGLSPFVRVLLSVKRQKEGLAVRGCCLNGKGMFSFFDLGDVWDQRVSQMNSSIWLWFLVCLVIGQLLIWLW